MLDLLAGLNGKIADLDMEIARRAREGEVSRRLLTVPGIGPISANAIAALAPAAETAGSQTAHAGDRRARQQDGADIWALLEKQGNYRATVAAKA